MDTVNLKLNIIKISKVLGIIICSVAGLYFIVSIAVSMHLPKQDPTVQTLNNALKELPDDIYSLPEEVSQDKAVKEPIESTPEPNRWFNIKPYSVASETNEPDYVYVVQWLDDYKTLQWVECPDLETANDLISHL